MFNRKVTISAIDYVVMFIFVVLFSCASLFNLGSFKATNFWYGNVPNKKIEFNFEKIKSLSEVSFYSCTVNGSYLLQARTNTGTLVLLDRNDDSKRSTGNVFCEWRKFVPINPINNVSSIIVTIIHPQINISRVLFKNNNEIVKNVVIRADFDKNLDDISQIIMTDDPFAGKYQKWIRYIGVPDYSKTSMYFDEDSYALMAYHYLQKISLFNTAHPQLGILLMIPGIKLFGMSPFGWRIMTLLAGVILMPIIYLFALKLFRKRSISIIATFLCSFDFMHLSISRVAVIEPFVTIFLVLEYLLLYMYLLELIENNKYSYTKLSLSAVCFALALSCKWTALYSISVVFLVGAYSIWRAKYKHCYSILLLWILIWVFLPFLIYYLTYIPLMILSKSNDWWHLFWHLQSIIFADHTVAMVQKNGIQLSPWWSWPLDIRPMNMYLWLDVSKQSSVSSSLLGNPAIWWATLPALCASFFQLVNKKSRSLPLFFICTIFIAQYATYALVKRQSYIYYFYSTTPFLFILLAYYVNIMLESNSKILHFIALFYCGLVVALFLIFYNVISANEISRVYVDNTLLWFKYWRF